MFALAPTLAAWVHDLDPFVVRFPEGRFLPAGIRWYGLSYLLGFFVGYLIIRRAVRVGITTLKPMEVADMVVTLAIGAVVGGRLGYVLFYDPTLLGAIDDFPYWGVLALTRGGMASHGGIIGAVIACWYYAYRHGHSWAHVLDVAALGTPLGLFFGRIANFINGELYGRPCAQDFPLAVQFPQELAHPTKAQEIAVQVFAVEHADLLPPRAGYDTAVAWIIQQAQQGNQMVIDFLRQVLTPRHPSQLYQAVLEGLVVMAVLLIVWWRPRKPLILGATFMLTYGIVRIIGEFFRMPDADIMEMEYAHWGISRGQLLSVFMVGGGVLLIELARRRDVTPMGGWRRELKSVK
ncbi:MAG: prolipoprotein diacylglyceryl transferase [Phycisphaeraceae bacterium]